MREGEREREKEKKSGKSNNERERSRYEHVLCTVIAYIMSYPKREIIIIYRLFLVHLIGRSRGQERVHWYWRFHESLFCDTICYVNTIQ